MITVIGIIGCTGRMGQAITNVIEAHPNACLAGGLTRKQAVPPSEATSNCPVVTDNPEDLFPQCDVLVDFSHASATATFAKIAAQYKKPFLSGTTGLSTEDLNTLKDVSSSVPVLYASNTSLSLAVTRQIVALASRLLQDQDYDISILDIHHKWKKDSPSGTALSLAQAVKEGNQGKQIPTHASLHTGSIVGEHTVMFAGTGEMVTIHHSVTDRRVFARGAVDAAIWLTGQKPGFYTMDDRLTA